MAFYKLFLTPCRSFVSFKVGNTLIDARDTRPNYFLTSGYLS